MPLAARRWLPLAILVLAALWLRTHDLARRPMHADEANQAVKVGQLLDSGLYAFDPRDHHGPTLYYAAVPIAWLRGQHSLAALDEATVRLVPALFGTAAVVLLYLLIASASDPASPRLALVAAAFLAISPPAVYYSRYFIQETLLLAFVLATLVAAQRWWRTGHLAWALATGAAFGLALATKITAPLFLAAAALSLLAAPPPPPASRRFFRDGLLALAAALLVAGLLFSSFGTVGSGLLEGFRSGAFGFHRAAGGDSGHEKPWWYYLRLFAWQRDGGLVFHQLAFSALSLTGAAVAFLSRQPRLRWAAAYTLLIAVALSLTPYKTPWHALHLVPGLALLAAGAIAALRPALLAAAVAATAILLQSAQVRLTSFQRPADARNPYAYVHSSPDVLKYRALAATALAASPDAIVRVISEESWPLPWYFRGLPRIGYWSSPPADCDAALVIASATQADAVRARLHGRYRESFLGLRPGFVCIVFTRLP